MISTKVSLTPELVETPLGWIALVFSDRGLWGCTPPLPSHGTAFQKLSQWGLSGTPSDSQSDLAYRLQAHLNGDAISYEDIDLDWEGVSAWQRTILEEAKRIPWGETRTYGWITARTALPQAARAAGQALAGNRFPIVIPCHRVVRADGSLGGYAGGVEIKNKLLALESKQQAH